jgi:hypothetical protein
VTSDEPTRSDKSPTPEPTVALTLSVFGVLYYYTAISAPDGQNLDINRWSHYLSMWGQVDHGWYHGEKELIADWGQVTWS